MIAGSPQNPWWMCWKGYITTYIRGYQGGRHGALGKRDGSAPRGGVPGGGGTMSHEVVHQETPGHIQGVHHHKTNLWALHWCGSVTGDKSADLVIGSGP